MHTRTGAWWLYATAVILAADAITLRTFGVETGFSPVVVMLLAILAGMFGVHVDHRDYLTQQRAKEHSRPRDPFGHHSSHRVARQQFNGADGCRKQPIPSLQGVSCVRQPVKAKLMLDKKLSGFVQAAKITGEYHDGKVKVSNVRLDPAGPALLMATPVAGVQLAKIRTQPDEVSGSHAWRGVERGYEHHAVVVVDAVQRDTKGNAAGIGDAAALLRAWAAAACQLQPAPLLLLQQGWRCRRTASMEVMSDDNLPPFLICSWRMRNGNGVMTRPSHDRLRPRVPILEKVMQSHGHVQLVPEISPSSPALNATMMDRASLKVKDQAGRSARWQPALPLATRLSLPEPTFRGSEDWALGLMEAGEIACRSAAPHKLAALVGLNVAMPAQLLFKSRPVWRRGMLDHQPKGKVR